MKKEVAVEKEVMKVMALMFLIIIMFFAVMRLLPKTETNTTPTDIKTLTYELVSFKEISDKINGNWRSKEKEISYCLKYEYLDSKNQIKSKTRTDLNYKKKLSNRNYSYIAQKVKIYKDGHKEYLSPTFYLTKKDLKNIR